MKKLISLALFCISFYANAQTDLGNVSQVITVNQTSIADATTRNFINTLTSSNVLELDNSKMLTLTNNPSEYLLKIPTKKDGILTISLKPANFLADDFKVMTPNGEVKVELPTYYWGSVVGKTKSSVAFTITKNGIEGMLSYDDKSLTIGKIKNNKAGLHIIYQSEEIPNNTPFETDGPIEKMVDIKNNLPTTANLEPSSCKAVRIHLEADYQMYSSWGNSVATVVNTMTSIFNQVGLLYYNEAVNLKLSTLFVWTTVDPYAAATSTSASLTLLANYWDNLGNTFNGDIIHMVSAKSLGGGIAYYIGGSSVYEGMTSRAVFASCGKQYAKGLSANITNNVVNLPTYSWNVEVIAHELGHNFGLPHTQSCTWQGGAIDNCYTTEGGCAAGPMPTNGGTVMSYCHLNGTGINFNNGFGPKPGAKMRAEVAAATCLTGLVSPAVTNLTVCGTGSFSLTATGCIGPNTVYRWYNAASAGTLLHTGPTFSTPTITSTTTYHVECTINANCTSARIPNTITISNSQLPTPTATGASFCGSSTVELNASGCPAGTNYNWYANSSGGSVLATGATFTTPSISATTNYYVSCALAGCTESLRATVTATRTAATCPYCIPSSQNCADGAGDVITLLKIDQGATNLLNAITGCSANGYSFTNTPIPTLSAGVTYSITVDNPGAYPEGLIVWIDYNGSGTFESPSEIIQTKLNSSTNWTTNTASFTVPNTATVGNTRLRARLLYDGNPTDPCEVGSYGETEDYLINITNGNCPQTLTLVSPTDDISTGTVTKKASSTTGKITATNMVSGTATRATYQAKSVLLNPGFKANTGTVFKAEIGGCN